MSNESNVKPNAPRKENISLLEMIRRRTGLLVGIVGLALLIFILEALIGSGASIFAGDEMVVGTINGKKVDLQDFSNQVEMRAQNYRARNQGRELDASMRGQLIDGLWNEYVVRYAIQPQFDKMGIVVGDDELYERVVANPVASIKQQLTDENGRINEQFSKPDGTLDLMKWRQAVQNVSGESEVAVKQMEDNVRETRRFEKFRALVGKAMYATSHEAANFHKAMHDMIKVSFVAKRFDMISDSAIKLTDDDLERYYNANSFRFRNKENTRKVEYVTFNVLPSEADVKAAEEEANRAAEALRGKSRSEDSVIIAQENETGAVSIRTMNRKNMVIRDSSVYTAAPGTVYGPYNEGAFFKVYKLEAIQTVSDSARVRHILIGLNDPQKNEQKRSKQQAKREADSLLTLIKDKKVSFDSLVMTVSDDLGSRDKGGDYGWFSEKAEFVEPYKNAGLMGKKGDISVVETQFGYHIIEVLDVSKGNHPSYVVGEIFKAIGPSEDTRQAVFAKASQFAGENNTAEKFDQAVEKEKLTKRLADDVREGSRDLVGIDNGRDIIQWAFSAKKGEVKLFQLEDRNIVAKLAGVKNKGVLPLEEVREEVRAGALKDKKGEMILAEFQKAGSSARLEDYAEKLNVPVTKQSTINMRNRNVDGVGFDDIFVGTACGTKVGSMSKPLIGESCVFVVRVEGVDNPVVNRDLKEISNQMEMELKGRSDADVFNAMKELSDIEDRKSKVN